MTSSKPYHSVNHSWFGESKSHHGKVASAHPYAIKAGLDILEKGGNAFDASIAVASTLNVVEPMMSGIGGYGTILTYDANNSQVLCLNGNGKFPKKTNSDFMRPPTVDFMKNRVGSKSISTPSNLHAWEEIHRKYGKMPWHKLFNTAIMYAEKGFKITANAAKWIETSFESFSAYSKEFYGKNGQPLKEDDLLIQTDLAITYKLISQKGSYPFYHGDIAARIDKQMKKIGSFLSLEDLHEDTVEWGEPLKLNFKGYSIYTAGKPGNAFSALFILGVMKYFPLDDLKHNSEEYLHFLAEVQKQSCKVRLTNPSSIGSLNDILSSDNFRAIAKSIEVNKVLDFNPPFSEENNNTTHFVVIDKEGNTVSATQTLGNMFGSKVMIEGTGIWMNNSMVFSTFVPKGNPMDALPGRYKSSSNSPIIILKEGRPWAALGTPGGHTIPQNVAQIILNLIVFEMNMQEAIDAPKIAFLEDCNLVRVENGISNTIINSLKKIGHKIDRGAIGNAMGIKILYNQHGNFFDVGLDKRMDRQITIQNVSM